ncbi:MAG TPA: tetratricopeptide repeat protein [Bryobacteraceae bacterium]|jgi:tetratricopeptide (TPR) repeat protein|nr:tetratricopeptide repeat protein [Bryobacteraceae bacterium]
MRSVLLLSVFAAASAASPADFNTLVDEARTALGAFDMASARMALDRACPSDARSLRPEQSAICDHYFAALDEALGLDEEAAGRYRRALTRWEQAGPAYLSRRISTMTNLGSLYRRQRRFPEAEKMLSQALDLSQPLGAIEPALHAATLGRLGTLYGDLDQPDRARSMLEETIGTLRNVPTAGAELAYTWSSLGMLELRAGRYKAGEADLRKAVSLASNVHGEENPETAFYQTDLALALMVEGQYNRAETLLHRSLFVIESRLGPDSPQLVNTLAELTSVERELGRFGTAEDYGEKALLILHSHMPPGRDEGASLEMVLLEANLGNLYIRERKLAQAESVLPAAVEAERRLFTNDRALADGLRSLAALRSQQRAWTEAESFYREAIGVYERRLGEDHPDLAPVLREYAAVLKHQGAPRAQVKNIEARARSIAAAG